MTTTSPSSRLPAEPESTDWDALLPARWYARVGHRWLDRALLVLLLPPALPLMASIALVNLVAFGDPRQVLFRQPRIGWRGRPFQILKFRTMREARGSEIGSWSTGQDHLRVTRFGRFLRNTHLDELPQLVNVLRGEMSFIGPRPEMVEIETWAREAVPGFGERLALRPGIAGLAQITQGYTGRDAAAYAEKLALNRFYARNMSPALDARIVLGTIAWMLRGKGWGWRQHAAVAGRCIAPARATEPARERPVQREPVAERRAG